MKKNWYAFIALIFFNLVFVLGIGISIYAMLASLWLIMGAFLLSPFLLFATNFLGIQHFSFYQTIASFGLFIVGTALIPFCRRATNYLLEVTQKYINFNKKLVYGESL